MADDGFRIRAMTGSELAVALDWAAAEGWNPGLDDADAFHAADPQGFLVGTLADEPISCISLVHYGADYAFLGFYIVRPDQRGRGYGWRIWQAAIARAGSRTVGLDGVIAQQDSYRSSGFVLAHRNLRFVGTGGGTQPTGLADLSSVPIAALLDYDAALFGAPRHAFLARWVAQPRATGLAVLDAGRLRGYGVIRQCREGHKIGPLFADTADFAMRLFDGLAATAPAAPVFLDIPEPNAAAAALVTKRGMTPMFETARMYLCGDPGLPLGRIFGITSFELG